MTCRHWIGSDTTGRVCGVECEGPLCPKHLEVARRRVAKATAKRLQVDARANAAWLARNAHRVPSWRVQLEAAERELERRTSSATNDRAAYGGATHTAVTRSQRSLLSDTNVTRVAELLRIIPKLKADIARASVPEPSGGAS